jgi:hypothetical protein
MKSSRLICGLITLTLFLIGGVGDVAAQGGNAKSKQKKKLPQSFKWVNPLTDADKKLTGLEHGAFQSRSLKQDVGYCIYLPPEYRNDVQATKRFPVVYYLHGGRPGSERKSIKLAAEFEKHIKAGSVSPMIYVFVNGGPVSHYNMPDDPKAQGADVFIKELIPHIDKTYRTIAGKMSRGLEGFSQGGRGTARLMFRYPELFCSASPGGGGHATEKKISENGGAESVNLKFAEGDNTWDLAHQYAERMKANHGLQDLAILVHVGDKGFNYPNNLEWMKVLESLGIKHVKIVVPEAGHSALQIYQKRGLEIMTFHATNFVKAQE